MARKDPAFPLLQRSLPPLTESEHNPGCHKLAGALLKEQILLRMNDEEWKSYHVPAKIKKDQPAETGDDLVDQW